MRHELRLPAELLRAYRQTDPAGSAGARLALSRVPSTDAGNGHCGRLEATAAEVLSIMIAHTTLPVSDFQTSREFYSKLLATLGYRNTMTSGEHAGFNDGKNTDFWIARQPAPEPLHLAFEAKSRAEVEAFHAAALAAGARDNGKPGYREYWPGYFAAFALDPDGHNIEAVWYDYSRSG